jgi:very-short-patch-repair endonuclease
VLAAAAQLAPSLPRVPIAVLVGPQFAWPRGLLPRARAVLEPGLVRDPGATGAEARAAVRDPALAPSVDELVRLGAAASTVAALVESHQALQAPGSDGAAHARSQVERFLARVLELHPSLRGLFALNRKVACQFGPGEAEVDFLASDLRLAVEVDGWHHFRDDESYRRDRRKDLALQQAGFTVLRLLAGDVTRRLPEILGQLTDAVAHQRQLLH